MQNISHAEPTFPPCGRLPVCEIIFLMVPIITRNELNGERKSKSVRKEKKTKENRETQRITLLMWVINILAILSPSDHTRILVWGEIANICIYPLDPLIKVNTVRYTPMWINEVRPNRPQSVNFKGSQKCITTELQVRWMCKIWFKNSSLLSRWLWPLK